jgi:hypothetical protein
LPDPTPITTTTTTVSSTTTQAGPSSAARIPVGTNIVQKKTKAPPQSSNNVFDRIKDGFKKIFD